MHTYIYVHIYICVCAMLLLCWWQLTNRVCPHSRRNLLAQQKTNYTIYIYAMLLLCWWQLTNRLCSHLMGIGLPATAKELWIFKKRQSTKCADGSWLIIVLRSSENLTPTTAKKLKGENLGKWRGKISKIVNGAVRSTSCETSTAATLTKTKET